MQLSKLEDQKNKGNLNLDFLKRKQKRSELTESKDQIKLDPKLVPVDFKKRGGGLQPILMGAYPSAQTFQTGNPSTSNLPPSTLDAAEFRDLELEVFEKPNFASPAYPQTTKAAKKQSHKLEVYESMMSDLI